MLLLALLGAPALAAADPLAIDATVKVLPNGLTVVLEEDHRTDAVALHLYYGVGSRDERAGEYGCAHLFEHVMFEGSAHVPQDAFDGWLTEAGGWNNAFTSEDQTAYHMQFPSGAAELALFLESDRMGFLREGLTPENIANQQRVVLQERAGGYAEPRGGDWDALTVLQFPPDHVYGHTVIGRVADIEAFELGAVQAFWERSYRPRNAVLGLVGNFETDEMLALVEHWFSDVPDPGPAPERAAPGEPQLPFADPRLGPLPLAPHGYLEDDVQDRTLYLSWATVPVGHPDEAALDLASWILVGGRGTRLDDRVYYGSNLAIDNDAFAWSAEVSGQFVVYATSPRTRLPKLERVLSRTVASLVSEPPSQAEIARALAMVGSGMRDALEQPTDRAEVLVDCQRLHGRPDCVAAEWERYQAVTGADVARAVQTWLVPERRVSLAVVPRGTGAGLPGAVLVELP